MQIPGASPILPKHSKKYLKILKNWSWSLSSINFVFISILGC